MRYALRADLDTVDGVSDGLEPPIDDGVGGGVGDGVGGDVGACVGGGVKMASNHW